MVLVYAGRRVQSMGAADLEAVATRIKRLLVALRPSAVVGAAADGADLLLVEAALGMPNGPEVHLVLPTPEQVFREQSVEPGWRDRFDRVLEEVRERGAVESLGLEDGEEAYRLANGEFLKRAADLAQGDERHAVVVIAAEGEGAMVQELAARAALSDTPVLRIDPSVDVGARPRCFVAMPYGTKPDPQRHITVDCDLVYSKVLVPALENAQLNYRRADEEIDTGLILQPMIEWIAEADLVVGDLQTGNFNVGWELGLRHLLRSGQTLLIRPDGTIPPFDLNALRHVGYKQDEQGVSDSAAIEAWAALAPFLASVDESKSDSPVDAVMEVQQWGKVRRREARDANWERLRGQLTLAREVGDADLMLEVLSSAHGVGPEHLHLLRAEAGVGLVRLGRYAEARKLLREVVAGDLEVTRPEAHVYYALSFYRPKDAGVDDYDEAEKVLRRVLVKAPLQPELHALLGAVAKRRLRLRDTPEEREGDLRMALEFYRQGYERDLNAYYEGINVIAVAVALHVRYGDADAGRSARELVPAVRVAATLATRAHPDDFWAAATLAECALHERLLGVGEPDVHAAYKAAGALRPPSGDLDSTLSQLDFLRLLELPEEPLSDAEAGLLAGAGRTTRPGATHA
ncbi:MAG TPA: tetratricopeptide repeat-containing protein [Thermoleophilaceae bacterium]|nr:tetratricopeptide repeat-containing protein [Thermoleophilaceae bacterium]